MEVFEASVKVLTAFGMFAMFLGVCIVLMASIFMLDYFTTKGD